MDPLPVGKLPPALLERLISKYVQPDPRMVVGPGIGRDAAVLDLGDRDLVAKTDPVTFATDEIGWYAVHVNANDVACCGAVPRWFLATLLLPEHHTTEPLAEAIFRQIAEACRALDITLCGGHTEVTYGLQRPIVVGHLLGEVSPERLVRPGGVRSGDQVILTKGIAIEGTSLLARERRQALAQTLSQAQLDRCLELLHVPGISVVREATLAMEAGGVHALHDPTEGGLATGLWELAQAAGVGWLIEEALIQILPECELLCRHFRLDPLGLIASGSLLIAADPDATDGIVARLTDEGIHAAVIGSAVAAEQGCLLRSSDGRLRSLPRFDRDEITRVLD
jgi:hydrogenase maturation factor